MSTGEGISGEKSGIILLLRGPKTKSFRILEKISDLGESKVKKIWNLK